MFLFTYDFRKVENLSCFKSGPNLESMEDWGVNYRALNDLFEISERRRNNYLYEVGVQMVEIYNEQVRDLLSDDGPQKRYPLSMPQFKFL